MIGQRTSVGLGSHARAVVAGHRTGSPRRAPPSTPIPAPIRERTDEQRTKPNDPPEPEVHEANRPRVGPATSQRSPPSASSTACSWPPVTAEIRSFAAYRSCARVAGPLQDWMRANTARPMTPPRAPPTSSAPWW